MVSQFPRNSQGIIGLGLPNTRSLRPSCDSKSEDMCTDNKNRFSAEITGTIIVQCIPVLRPFLQEVHAAISSRTFGHSQATAKTTVSQHKFDPSAGTYSVTVTSVAAEKAAAQKRLSVDTSRAQGQVSEDFQPRPVSRGLSNDFNFDLPIQNPHTGWTPVNKS